MHLSAILPKATPDNLNDSQNFRSFVLIQVVLFEFKLYLEISNTRCGIVILMWLFGLFFLPLKFGRSFFFGIIVRSHANLGTILDSGICLPFNQENKLSLKRNQNSNR